MEGTFTVQCNLGIFDESLGIKSECSNRPSVDYVIQVGAEARVESIYQIVRTAIHSESGSITYHGDGPYFEITSLFHVYSNESLSIEWISKANCKVQNLLTKGSLNHLKHQLKKTPKDHFNDISQVLKKASNKKIITNVYLEDWSNGMKNSKI